MSSRSVRDHVHELAVLVTAYHEGHHAIGLGEQGVILAAAHVQAGVETGATLPHDDVAGGNGLAAIHLHAQAFAFRVAAVTGTAACLFVCHVALPRAQPVIPVISSSV